MTFSTEAAKAARKPFVIVELDLDTCAESYGVSPCTAAGMNKCFNTFATCDDTANFNRSIKTYSYSDIALLGEGIPALVDSVDTAPTEISRKGMAVRANCTVRLNDTRDNDTFTDPYLSTRNYIASDQGTYWGKWLARNVHYYRRTMRIKYGFLEEDDSLTSVETYTYLIDQITRDSRTGKVTIRGKTH